ncbi:hypothetical protein MPTA7396_6330 [Mycoplasmoides pneumoniae]|nr:hypothetical protein KPI25BX_2130 [Mycoplasmoides pneumoniae]GLL58050.1 hypothetical protein Y1241N_0970 [Mycoplasmoides pneumoniae]GLL58886.1 hypothetical protein Y12242BV_2100 [Mycoplasmoides pneumoniae]GLL59651.1 hypothetical protein Y12382J_2570 [Mycoplasmoides pneumoniae]GLL60494.1 hypothetical protein OA571N_3770 [Mycoplasmoides pneumoniae]
MKLVLNFKSEVYSPKAGSGFNACLSSGWTALTLLLFTGTAGAQAVKTPWTSKSVKKTKPFNLYLRKSGVALVIGKLKKLKQIRKINEKAN